MTNTPAQSPIVIVGGGLSGLSAAVMLARAGHAVTLFEKANHPGGRARTQRYSDFSFNQGAHALYRGGLGEKLLNGLGIHVSGSSPARNKYLALSGGKLHALPYDVSSMLRTRLLTLAAKTEFARFYSNMRHVKLADIQNVSWQDWLEQQVREPQVRQLLLAGARVASYTNAPDKVSASLILPLLTAQVRYLDGGWQTLVDALWQVAQQAGVHMTHARVAAIEPGEEEHAVRLADGSCHAASAVLLAVEPAMASALVADGTQRALSRWAAQAMPARIACLDIALSRLPEPRHLLAIGMERPLYYSVHSAWAKLAPEGSALIHTMKYLRPDESAEPEAARQELESLLDLVQPGWRAHVVRESFLPHMVASNAIVQAEQGGLSGRPGPAVPGIRNLYVAGDWVGPEGQLLDACLASARSAAHMITTTLAARPGKYAVVN